VGPPIGSSGRSARATTPPTAGGRRGTAPLPPRPPRGIQPGGGRWCRDAPPDAGPVPRMAGPRPAPGRGGHGPGTARREAARIPKMASLAGSRTLSRAAAGYGGWDPAGPGPCPRAAADGAGRDPPQTPSPAVARGGRAGVGGPSGPRPCRLVIARGSRVGAGGTAGRRPRALQRPAAAGGIRSGPGLLGRRSLAGADRRRRDATARAVHGPPLRHARRDPGGSRPGWSASRRRVSRRGVPWADPSCVPR